MWGSCFAQGPAAIMENINASIDCDQKLYRQDIESSLSHVAMLAQTKIISHSDYEKLCMV
ncbi:argininosuccinate lyase [Bartonella sp. WD16.2]|nr:argininosuccinate lyase [Bartonella sp. WD16.2]